MRLLHESAIRPETAERLRALSPELEVVDAAAIDGFDLATASDPDLDILIWRRSPPDLARFPRLRWLQLRSHGVDHLAADPPWLHGLAVTSARGVYSIPMAEYVTAMLLRAQQPAAWATDQAAHHWPPIDTAPRGSVLRGRTAVIVGYGSIGREVGRQLAALGVRIVAVKARPEAPADTGFRMPGTGDPDGSIPERIVGPDRLSEVVAAADIVILTLPLTDATRGLSARRRSPPCARVRCSSTSPAGISSTSRALLAGLRAGCPARAVLDVFVDEPLPPDSPWWEMPQVVVTPHASSKAMPEIYDTLVVENVRRYLAGEPLLNQVDPDRGY